jgi:hypothetical protein
MSTAGPPASPDLTEQTLAPITRDDGSVDRAKVAALLERDPSTFTVAEALAMYNVFFSPEFCANHGLSDLSYTLQWGDALIEVVGGTITRETLRNGETVDRTVTRHRGRGDIRAFHVRATGATTPPPAIGRARAREHRPAGTRRTSSSSSTSSADPGSESDEPEPEPRICACGCGRDISHKRAGALTFDATCRKRLSRAAPDVLADDVREERLIAWSAATRGEEVRGHRWLTEEHNAELTEFAAAERLARSRATTPRRTEMDALAFTRWLMESNGTSTKVRHRGSPWRTPSAALRTRMETVA